VTQKKKKGRGTGSWKRYGVRAEGEKGEGKGFGLFLFSKERGGIERNAKEEEKGGDSYPSLLAYKRGKKRGEGERKSLTCQRN